MYKLIKYILIFIFILFNGLISNASGTFLQDFAPKHSDVYYITNSLQLNIEEYSVEHDFDIAQSYDNFELTNICNKNDNNDYTNLSKLLFQHKLSCFYKILVKNSLAYCDIHKISPNIESAISTRAP